MESDDRRKLIGRQLQKLRKDAGYKSAAAFAKQMGIKTGTYTSYEQGEAGFSYERAWDMADALNVTLDELGGRDWPPGGSPPLSPDERGLVDSYRRMEDKNRESIMDTARTFAVAADLKRDDDEGIVEMAGIPVREERRQERLERIADLEEHEMPW